MKRSKDKVLIFIASVITGTLIAINFNEGKVPIIFTMKSKEYKEAVDERNILYNEISDLRENNKEISQKLIEYNQSDEKHNKVMEDMKSQLKDYSDILGVTKSVGSGVIITISDGDYDLKKDTKYEVDRRTLHSIDAAIVLNELKNAGAEAIALNNYRVLVDTSVECNWAFITFNDNDKTMEAQPFNFYAIGNPDELEAAILSEGSYINRLMTRKLKIKVEKSDEIIIPATTRIIEPQFMQRLDS